jgi:hypothetical protein
MLTFYCIVILLNICHASDYILLFGGQTIQNGLNTFALTQTYIDNRLMPINRTVPFVVNEIQVSIFHFAISNLLKLLLQGGGPGVVLGTSVYSAGGSFHPNNQVFIFDIYSNLTSQTRPMPRLRSLHSIVCDVLLNIIAIICRLNSATRHSLCAVVRYTKHPVWQRVMCTTQTANSGNRQVIRINK